MQVRWVVPGNVADRSSHRRPSGIVARAIFICDSDPCGPTLAGTGYVESVAHVFFAADFLLSVKT